MIKILVVGAGSIGRRHIITAQSEFPNCEIAVLRRPESLTPNPEGCRVFQSIQEALSFNPDLVIICSPASHHLNQARQFAEAGINLLIEKPLSTDTVGIEEILELCSDNQVILQTAYNLRFLDSLQLFKDVCQSSDYGSLLSIESVVGQYLPDWRPDQDYKFSVSAQEKLGGGVLLELSHEIDYLIWIFGEISWVRATLARKSNLDIDVEDSAHITFGIQNKPDSSKVIGTLNLDMIRRNPIRKCFAYFENGTIEWDGLLNQVSVYQPSTNHWNVIYTGQISVAETYRIQLRSFVEKINRKKFESQMELSGLKVLKVVEAARKSSITGAEVGITPKNLKAEIYG